MLACAVQKGIPAECGRRATPFCISVDYASGLSLFDIRIALSRHQQMLKNKNRSGDHAIVTKREGAGGRGRRPCDCKCHGAMCGQERGNHGIVSMN